MVNPAHLASTSAQDDEGRNCLEVPNAKSLGPVSIRNRVHYRPIASSSSRIFSSSPFKICRHARRLAERKEGRMQDAIATIRYNTKRSDLTYLLLDSFAGSIHIPHLFDSTMSCNDDDDNDNEDYESGNNDRRDCRRERDSSSSARPNSRHSTGRRRTHLPQEGDDDDAGSGPATPPVAAVAATVTTAASASHGRRRDSLISLLYGVSASDPTSSSTTTLVPSHLRRSSNSNNAEAKQLRRRQLLDIIDEALLIADDVFDTMSTVRTTATHGTRGKGRAPTSGPLLPSSGSSTSPPGGGDESDNGSTQPRQ